MGILFDGSSSKRSAAVHERNKQNQADKERRQQRADEYNAMASVWLTDMRAKDMMAAYLAMGEAGRTKLWRHVQELLAAHPRQGQQ